MLTKITLGKEELKEALTKVDTCLLKRFPNNNECANNIKQFFNAFINTETNMELKDQLMTNVGLMDAEVRIDDILILEEKAKLIEEKANVEKKASLAELDFAAKLKAMEEIYEKNDAINRDTIQEIKKQNAYQDEQIGIMLLQLKKERELSLIEAG